MYMHAYKYLYKNIIGGLTIGIFIPIFWKFTAASISYQLLAKHQYHNFHKVCDITMN